MSADFPYERDVDARHELERRAARQGPAAAAELLALTLWRPWPAAFVHGIPPKRCENRDWPPPTKHIGKVFALHAGLRYERGLWAWPGGYEPPPERECPTGIVMVAPLLGALDRRFGRRHVHRPAVQLDSSPEAHAEDARIRSQLAVLDLDPWWVGKVGWLFGDPIVIDPVPCKGAMGIWRVPDATAAEVWRRVEMTRGAAA